MIDPRYSQLARNLTSYSTSLQPGEKALIDAFDVPDEMIIELLRSVRERGAIPYVNLNHARVSREIALEATEDQMRVQGAVELQRMKSMDAYIALRGSQNIFESSDVVGVIFVPSTYISIVPVLVLSLKRILTFLNTLSILGSSSYIRFKNLFGS